MVGKGIEMKEKGGFSLIEVLAATAILIVIVLVMSTIFHQSSLAWSAGYRRSGGSMMARAVVGMILKDLEGAVSDSQYFLPADTDIQPTAITFVTLSGTPDVSGKRCAVKVKYSYAGDVTRESWQMMAGSGYGTWAPLSSSTIATNLSEFSFQTPIGYVNNGVLPEWVKIRVKITRDVDVSKVGSRSLGPDGVYVLSGGDDIRSL